MVLEKICGETQERLFVGFSDLFQKLIDAFCPDFWPFSEIQLFFDKVFNDLQTQLKPFARKQGEQMGKDIEAQVNAYVLAKVNDAKRQIEALRSEAIGQINSATTELNRQRAEIENLIQRIQALEGKKGLTSLFKIGG